MDKNTSTGPEAKTESPQDTTPAVSTTSLLPPLSEDEYLKVLGLPSMTIEEAGEEILKGEVYFKCAFCDAKGGWHIHDQVDVCQHCSGMGNIYNRRYSLACRVLELELPMLPDSAFVREEMAKWNALNVSAEADQVFYQRMQQQGRLVNRRVTDFSKILDRSRSILKRQ